MKGRGVGGGACAALTPGAPDDSSVARWALLHAQTYTNIPTHAHLPLRHTVHIFSITATVYPNTVLHFCTISTCASGLKGGRAKALLRGNHRHKPSLCFVQGVCLQTERCGQADGEVRVGRLRRPHGACLPCTYPLHSSPPVISLLVEPSTLQTRLPVLFALKGNDVQL